MLELGSILLPVDFSDRSAQTVRNAVPLARRFGSELILLHVLPPHYEFGSVEMGSAILEDLIVERHARAIQHIQDFICAELHDMPVKRVLLEGDPAHEIVKCARNEKAALIVMPTHGHGTFRRLLVGSVTAKVLHDATCPIWTGVHVAEPASSVTVRRIVCAVDLGPSSASIAAWALDFAARFGAAISLIHALPSLEPNTEGFQLSPEWRQHMIESARAGMERLEDQLGAHPETSVRLGEVAAAVSEEVRERNADLVIIGRGSATRVFGGRLPTHAYAIIRSSPCPVVSL